MCVNGRPEDVVYTDQVSGVPGNFLRATVPGAGGRLDAGSAQDKKRWKDIWSAGQGVALPGEVKPIAEIVADIVNEYAEVVRSLPA